MSPELKSLNPTLWEPHAVLRESFLCLRLSEGLADWARGAGWSLYRETLHCPRPELDDPLQRVLMAHARDLRQQEGALAVLGSAGEMSSREQYRAQIARHVGSSLSRLATTLEAASR